MAIRHTITTPQRVVVTDTDTGDLFELTITADQVQLSTDTDGEGLVTVHTIEREEA